MNRSGKRGETSAAEAGSWSTGDEIEELDDMEEQDMDTEDDESGDDDRVVIAPKRRQVKVQLDAHGRQVAFVVIRC